MSAPLLTVAVLWAVNTLTATAAAMPTPPSSWLPSLEAFDWPPPALPLADGSDTPLELVFELLPLTWLFALSSAFLSLLSAPLTVATASASSKMVEVDDRVKAPPEVAMLRPARC